MPLPGTPRTILGIETSCDETAAAVVRGRTVLSNVIASQHELHAEYQGVVPEIASRAHAERLLPIVRQAVAEAGVTLADIDAVAIGNRPGLIGSLLVGVSGAKALAWSLGKPIVAVDHIHAHLYAGCMGKGSKPVAGGGAALGLVVSGGHTSMYLMRSPTDLTRLGATIDDAIGEAYDKVANILGLGFPGGPMVDRLAQRGDAGLFDFPISRLAPGSLDFSFSGLKTAVLYAHRGVPNSKEPHTVPRAEDVCAGFQRAAVRAITLKLERALEQHPSIRSLLVGGGVSANSHLRQELTAFAAKKKLDLRLPPMDLCLDNAAMIAGLGHEMLAARTPPWTGDELVFSAVASSR